LSAPSKLALYPPRGCCAASVMLVLLACSFVQLDWKLRVGSTNEGSAALLAVDGLWCCGRGFQGGKGHCILAAADSVCCAGEIPLLCAAGSTCPLNAHGRPYCCAPGMVGCRNVCISPAQRDSILNNGGTCNYLAPQGLKTPGRVQYLDLPWDPEEQRYEIGQRRVLFEELAFPRGTGNFTIEATFTPRRPNRIGISYRAVFLFRRDATRRLALYLGFTEDGSILFELGNGTSASSLSARYGAQEFRVNVSFNVKWIRQGGNMFIYANNTQIGNLTDQPIFDLDPSLAFPLEMGPVLFPNEDIRPSDFADPEYNVVPLDAYVSNISMSSTADFP